MDDLITDSEEVVKKTTSKKNSKIAVGLDIGTMTLIMTRSDKGGALITRNMFLEVDTDEVPMSEFSDLNYVKSDDGTFIIGDDAFKMANLFNKKVSRPMEQGMISPNEIDAVDVLALMIKNMFGYVNNKDIYCNFSVPAEAVDSDRSVTYHSKVFTRILGAIGVNHTSCNEAMAVIYSECKKEQFSGVALSFGAGMCNVCCSWKAVQAFEFATSRSGDWIDTQVANSLNMTPNRVTNIKEKYLNLEEGFHTEKNKKRRRVLEALTYYYSAMMDYTIKNLIKQFENNFDLEIDDGIPIVIAGGTALIPGFLDLFKETIKKYELPFDISEIRMAKEPHTCISRGLLIKTMSDIGLK